VLSDVAEFGMTAAPELKGGSKPSDGQELYGQPDPVMR